TLFATLEGTLFAGDFAQKPRAYINASKELFYERHPTFSPRRPQNLIDCRGRPSPRSRYGNGTPGRQKRRNPRRFPAQAWGPMAFQEEHSGKMVGRTRQKIKIYD